MGNLINKNEENNEEKKENLETEEIPPDTQINNDNKDIQETEIISEQINQENHEEDQVQEQQNQQIEQAQENQEQQIEQAQENQEKQIEQEQESQEQQIEQEQESQEQQIEQEQESQEQQIEQAQESQEQQGGEAVEQEEKEIKEEKDEQEEREEQEEQEGGINEAEGDRGEREEVQQYQFVQDGQLYIRQNGQLYKVVQNVETAQEGEGINTGVEESAGQEKQNREQFIYDQTEQVQIAQPIYQYIDQNQQIQQIQPNLFYGNVENQQIQQSGQYLANIGIEQFQQMQQGGQFESNIDNNQENAQDLIGQADIGNYQQKLINIQSKSPMDKSKMSEQSHPSKKREFNRGKKEEPKDSIPKVHIISNRGGNIKSSNISSDSFLRVNLNNKYYNFTGNKSDKKIIKSNQVNIKSKIVKNENKKSLRENEKFFEIPRKEYDNYLNKEIIVLNNGMNTGEYKFIGEKTVIKEADATGIGKLNINEEEVIQEINRRNKAKKEKKVSYEIIDKFYVLTEVRGKTIKRLDKKGLDSKNKNNFYASLENNNNIKGNNSNNYTGNLEGNNKNISNGQFPGGNNASRASDSRPGTYYEFRSQIPFTSNPNFTTFNNINSITSMPTDNYSKYILEQINRIRLDPQSFIGVIEDAKANIAKDRFGSLIYNGKKKIALTKGESCFNEAIEFLKNADSMDPLKYISYLTVIPPQNDGELKDKDDLGRKVTDMINGGINIKSYWRDVIKDPEISFLLMIVDDNGAKSGMRRRDILNPNMKFIGISSVEINNDFVCYITLS